MAEENKNRKVFFSYSWSSQVHKEWVLQLAKRLQNNGVDVELDQWSLKEGHDKYAYMEKMVTDPQIDKVIVICDKQYKEKADAQKGGVGTESTIISSEVYNQVEQEKFIPLLRERGDSGEEFLPTFFKSTVYIDFSRNSEFHESYERLVRVIFDKPAITKPALGVPPAYITSTPTLKKKTTHNFEAFKDAITDGRPARFVSAKAQEYLEDFLDSFEDFRIDDEEGSDSDEPPFDQKVWDSIEEFGPYLVEFSEFITLIARYSDDEILLEHIKDFFEQALVFNSRPESMTSWRDYWFDNYRYITRELFTYLIAILIMRKKYDWAVFFMNEEYFYKSGTSPKSEFFSAFMHPIESLNTLRNRRLNQNRTSVVADLLKERAEKLKVLPFEEIVQTELILTLRGILGPEKHSYVGWYPESLVYRSDIGTFPLFTRIESPKYGSIIAKLVGVKDATTFKEKMLEAVKEDRFRGYQRGLFPYDWLELVGVKVH